MEIRRCYGAKRGIISSEVFAGEANTGANAPFAHSRDLDIDGLAEMSLQANISARGEIGAETTPQVTGGGKSPEVGSTGNIFCDAAHADGDFGASDEDRTATQVGQAAHGSYVDGESCEPEPDTTFDHTHCSFDGGDAPIYPIYNMGRIIFPAEKQKALFACFGGFRPGEITVDMFMEL